MVEEQGYLRSKITYPDGEGGIIPAYLLLPKGAGPFPGVLLHHQHNSERHLGKSEVCGLIGDPLQAFGPVFAKNGITVLAPDSICFEDRRANRKGTEIGEGDSDTLQHFNEMCYRLLRGDTLMRKVLHDAALGLSILENHPRVDSTRLGTLGHSYGGNTVLFHAALDTRLRFACSSGAACTYQHKMANGTGIEMAEVIPGFVQHYDIQDLVKCVAPRAILLVSSSEDKFSMDTEQIVKEASSAFESLAARDKLEHYREQGGHALTQTRFDRIVSWITSQSQPS